MSKFADILHKEAGINKARSKFIVLFVESLIRVRTVNLTEIALNFSPAVKERYSYRRIQSFFKTFSFPYPLFARLIMSLLPSGPLVISIDRTNWKFGVSDTNIFMLTAEYRGVAIPMLWHLLPKRGNSNQLERIDLLKEFINLFGKGRIKNLLADREFIGEKWISYLSDQEIPFTIRVKHNMIAEDNETGKTKLSDLFGSTQTKVYDNQSLFNRKVNIAGKRLDKKQDYLILITNGDAKLNIEEYRRRWKIETMFSSLKTRGFNLEDTHMTDDSKLKMLVGILAIAYVFSFLVGIQKEKYDPIKIKQHGRKAVSTFRYGLDQIRKAISDTKHFYRDVLYQINLIIDNMTVLTMMVKTN
ncbi:MAG: IS4 family transposase [Cyclobacteriaceae bacterium]